MKFLKSQPDAFGLDVSDFSLKIAKLKKNGGFFDLVSWQKTEIPPGIIQKGQIQKEDELAAILRQSLKDVKGGSLQTKYAVCSLPEEEAFFRVIQLPSKAADEDIGQMLKYELEAYVPLKIEELYYDYKVIPALGASAKFTNVLISAAPQKIVDSYLSVFKKAGIRPCVLEIESQAVARALIPKSQSLESIIILDIGAGGTGWTIFSGPTVIYTGHINISGRDFTNLISKNMNVEFKEAEELKRKIGSANDGKKVWESLVSVLTALSQEIKSVVDFYKEHSIEFIPDGRIAKIFLAGGDSLIKGLPEFLRESVGLPVELGNPWVNIVNQKNSSSSQPISKEESLMFATALGLALRGINL